MKIISLLLNKRFQKILAGIMFITGIGIIYLQINITKKLNSRPRGEHIWAQVDRASMALCYYMDDAPFLLPRCHRTSSNPEGITAGECPIIPYAVSKMYKLGGFDEFYHRIFIWGISLAGLICSYLLVLKLIRHHLTASIISLLWVSSPNIIYYSFSFLPDVPALAFIIIALYFLPVEQDKKPVLRLGLFAVFFTLASLVKVSAMLPVLAVGLAYLIRYRKSVLGHWKKRIIFALFIFLPSALGFLWIMYARQLLYKYGIFTFLMKPAPPLSRESILIGLEDFFKMLDHYNSNLFLTALAVATILGLFFIRKSNRFLALSTLFIYLTALILFFAVFQKATHHAYYLIPFQVAVLFHLAWIADILLKMKRELWLELSIYGAMVLFVWNNMLHVRYNIFKRWGRPEVVYSRYYDLENYLKTIGINYSDRVVSYDDATFNISLYLMNRKGWTLDQSTGKERMHRAFKACDYAVLNDTSLVHHSEMSVYFDQVIGEHNDLVIYRLKHE